MPLGEHPRQDSGADKMKITRSFTLDYLVCLELKKQKNQSRFVEDAVREKLKSDLAKLKIKFDCEECNVSYTPRNTNSARDSMLCRRCGSTLYAQSAQ